MRKLEKMAHISSNQTERLVAINKLLPELENFLRKTLEDENLSENANMQRDKFLSQLEALIKPPQLPPRGMKKMSTTNTDDFTNPLQGRQEDDKPSRDFISKQREISWRQKESDTTPLKYSPAVPYTSQKKHQEDETSQSVNVKPSSPSQTDETGIYERIRNESGSGYEKITNESGSGKYIDILNYEKQNNPPPVPARTHRTLPIVSTSAVDVGDSQPIPRFDVKHEIFIQDLKNPTCTGPLKELRNNLKIWCVLKNKNLYIFKDLTQPASQILNMTEYDVHLENMTNLNFRLSKAGFPSLLLSVENEDDYKQWVNELEKCKYEDLDNIIPEFSRRDDADAHIIGENEDDSRYEKPMEVIAKFEKLAKIDENQQKKTNSSIDIVYEDMSGSVQNANSFDYHQNDQEVDEENLGNLRYDEELPPIPVSSDEDHPKMLQDASKVLLRNRKLPEIPFEEQISGSFESMSSTSDDDRSAPSERKPRSSSGPPAYNVSYSGIGSTDRKFSSSLPRHKLQNAFFNDPSAIFCGVLHQRRVLAVWQKRFCKVKNEMLLCYRNADNEDKPVLEVHLPGSKVALCDKETWRSHSFKMFQPNTETLYFAAETREQLMTWLNVLVKEMDKEKFSGKETLQRMKKDYLAAQPSEDTTSVSSVEKKFGEDGSACDADSESAAASSDDEDTSYQENIKAPRQQKVLNKQASSSKPEEMNIIIEGYLHKKEYSEWIRCRCMVKNGNFIIHKSTNDTEIEIQIPLEITNMALEISPSDSYLIRLSWDQNELILMAENGEEWNDWISALRKLVKSTIEDKNFATDVTYTPLQSNNGKRSIRFKKKKKLKNGNIINNQSIPGNVTTKHKTEFSCNLRCLTSLQDRGDEKFCKIKDRFLIIINYNDHLDLTFGVTLPGFEISQEKQISNERVTFTIRSSHQPPLLVALDSTDTFVSLLEVLWTQGAKITGEEGTLAYDFVKTMRRERESKSLKSESNLNSKFMLDGGDEQPTGRTVSDGEQNFIRPRKLTKQQKSKSNDRGPERAAVSSNKSGGSRMSAFFRSLPRKNRKKYDIAPDVTDGLPKSQLSGFVNQVSLDENGMETLNRRHCKVSGKIFYAYDIDNEIKPIFKVPLRNAHIEDLMEQEIRKYLFEISSMESQDTFKFVVETEEEFGKWFAALYLIDSKANKSGQSSRESLLDESKHDDTGKKLEQPFSGSNSSNSLTSILSKQAKSLGGSEDEMRGLINPRKISEEVFNSSIDSAQHSGYLFEVVVTETNDVKSRTKTRRWCVLRKSWVEIYTNKNDKVPMRGIAIGHHSVVAMEIEETGEKYAMCLRSEDEDYILCASNYEDYNKWMSEFRKVTKKQGRRTSDTAKLALKSASGGIRQLLSSSSLSSSGKRDSKRATIVLNDDDKKVVEKFTDTVESGNKISGMLTVVMKDGKLTKPKRRLCTIRDGKFCIAKRSKPKKYIDTIELLNVAILDECDLRKGLYRFRLDYGDKKCMTFETVDHETADNWMVGISMAILLERLTSRDKFPQQKEEIEIDYDQSNEAVSDGLLDNQPEMNGLGLIDVSPVLIERQRESNSSNLSNDIKEEIDRKISYGSNYLNPLSNLLDSAFDETLSQYACSTAPSSREGTLERNRVSCISTNARKNSDGIIIEEASEEIETVDDPSITDNKLQDKRDDGVEMKREEQNSPNVFIDISNYDNDTEDDLLPTAGSVSNTIAKFEQLGSPEKHTTDDSVFHNLDDEPDDSQLEKQLAGLLKERESLEKEQNVILDRIPDLQKVVRETKARKLSENNSEQYKNEFDITKADLQSMQTRLGIVRKRLRVIESAIKKGATNIPENFRTRGTVISPHVIV